jgi:pimeloyl-ACP methyl ester carboxylesterase
VATLLLASCASTQQTGLPSITKTPVQSIETADGVVQYRSIGVGTPLVLIMGFAGSQDLWPPKLVDDLAAHHRVITFNNAGIGATSSVPGSLSISAMADQTATLITALHLSHPGVFGWSMGGMIAQALVVRHPGVVERLVLGATTSGNGQAVSSPELADFVAATEAHDNAAVLQGLFPLNKVAVLGPAFVRAVRRYPQPVSASVAVDQAQGPAIEAWMNGEEPAGHGQIRLPTLIGDGAQDALFPASNARVLAAGILGSRPFLYPDAGHAFLYQDEAAWAAAMNHFLG